LGFSQLTPTNQDVVRKLSALLRVADALDFRREQRVESVSCALNRSKILTLAIASSANASDEIRWASKKGELIREVFNLELEFKKTKTTRSR
jgi:hypothetical protein